MDTDTKIFGKGNVVLLSLAFILGGILDYWLLSHVPSGGRSLVFWFMVGFISCVSIALGGGPILISLIERKGDKQFLIDLGVLSHPKDSPDYTDIKSYLSEQGLGMGFYSLIVFFGQKSMAFWGNWPSLGGIVTGGFVACLLFINVGMIAISFMDFLCKFVNQNFICKIVALLFAVFILMLFSQAGMNLGNMTPPS